MGLFGNNSQTVRIGGQKLKISFLPKPDGKSRGADDEKLYIVTATDRKNNHDRIFLFHETAANTVSLAAAEAIDKSKNHGIPVIMDVMDRAIIVDAFDTPEMIVDSYRGTKENDIQSGLDSYRERLEIRARTLKAATAMPIETGTAHRDGVKVETDGHGATRIV